MSIIATSPHVLLEGPIYLYVKILPNWFSSGLAMKVRYTDRPIIFEFIILVQIYQINKKLTESLILFSEFFTFQYTFCSLCIIKFINKMNNN